MYICLNAYVPIYIHIYTYPGSNTHTHVHNTHTHIYTHETFIQVDIYPYKYIYPYYIYLRLSITMIYYMGVGCRGTASLGQQHVVVGWHWKKSSWIPSSYHCGSFVLFCCCSTGTRCSSPSSVVASRNECPSFPHVVSKCMKSLPPETGERL